MIINNEGIEQVNLHNTTFIYFRPTKKTDLNKGFYELLQDGKRLRLLARKTYSVAQINVEKIAKTRKHQTEYFIYGDRKSTRLNSSHIEESRMPSSA